MTTNTQMQADLQDKKRKHAWRLKVRAAAEFGGNWQFLAAFFALIAWVKFFNITDQAFGLGQIISMAIPIIVGAAIVVNKARIQELLGEKSPGLESLATEINSKFNSAIGWVLLAGSALVFLNAFWVFWVAFLAAVAFFFWTNVPASKAWMDEEPDLTMPKTAAMIAQEERAYQQQHGDAEVSAEAASDDPATVVSDDLSVSGQSGEAAPAAQAPDVIYLPEPDQSPELKEAWAKLASAQAALDQAENDNPDQKNRIRSLKGQVTRWMNRIEELEAKEALGGSNQD